MSNFMLNHHRKVTPASFGLFWVFQIFDPWKKKTTTRKKRQCIVYFPPNFQTCWNTVYLFIGLLYRTSNDNFNKSKNSPITAATEWYSAVRLVGWMNEPSCRRQRHWTSCSGPTWINSARIPVITNPSFYFSLRQGRRREISNVSTQSSLWHKGRTVVALKSLIWILTSANHSQKDFSLRWHKPVKVDGCTMVLPTAPALAMWDAGVILVQPLHLIRKLKLSSSWGV